MINTLYQLVNKGSWRALSLILAIFITICFFFNINEFASLLRESSPYWVMLIILSDIILWIHGIGFDIRSNLLKLLFSPVIAYIVVVISLIENIFK